MNANWANGVVVGVPLLSLFIPLLIAIPIDNGIVGTPRIFCVPEGIMFMFEPEQTFTGKVFVKGLSHREECFSGNGEGASSPYATPPLDDSNRNSTVVFKIRYGTCNIHRQRSLEPRGVYMQTILIVQFHSIFITKVDKAFQTKCFYMEDVRTVSAGLDVSKLPTTPINNQFPMPKCTYSVRKDSIEGETVTHIKVGDPVYHVWECDETVVGVYGMLVHSCYVEDGSGENVLLVDTKGCAMDPYILGHPRYSPNLMTVFRESHIFKFADRTVLYFFCQIRLCMKNMDTCDGMTPPRCPNLRNKKRRELPPGHLQPLLNSSHDHMVLNPGQVIDPGSWDEAEWADNEMDVRSPQLIVLDPGSELEGRDLDQMTITKPELSWSLMKESSVCLKVASVAFIALLFLASCLVLTGFSYFAAKQCRMRKHRAT